MKGKNLLIFAFGAAVGAIVSYEVTKRKYSEMAQDEINSVKEVYAKRAAAREKPDLSELSEIVKDKGYSSETSTDEKPSEKDKEKRPYVISPDDFGTIDGYEQISLTLYSDGVLADENNEKIENVDETVGEESLSDFGTFEEDSVFVRNDARKTDYEILLDGHKFSEVMAKSPHKIG